MSARTNDSNAIRIRLKELLEQANEVCANRFREETKAVLKRKGRFNSRTDRTESFSEITVDHLIENGVLAPPCKVGDTAYLIIEDVVVGEKYIVSQQINDVSTRGIFISTSTLEENCNEFEPYSDFGKTVFLTKEEAEKALRGEG